MPGEPIEMPSDTVMVLNKTPLPPAASAPATASRARSAICMLHGVMFAHVEAIPICGLVKSASWNPTARNIARDGACFTPSTTRREFSRGSVSLFFDAMRQAYYGTDRDPDVRASIRLQRKRICMVIERPQRGPYQNLSLIETP